MDIQIADKQRVARVSKLWLRRLVAEFMTPVGRMTIGRRWRSVSIVLAEDRLAERLGRRYFSRSGTTDVISFRYPSHSAEDRVCDGEVIVNVQRAVAEGLRRLGVARELALYVAHGCDHLTGATDDTPQQRQRMRRRELRWLRRAAASGLLQDSMIRRHRTHR